ncbi:cell wall hydrolase [Priestia flexa]|uniref:cell wall hydrolase n=1 Tax=Priestia TaxID=2800373 RepID=UPI0021FEE949|nr:LysM peptidoglycan-binding domain-containing protein [Bacillus sp. 1780r2a1]
MKKGKLTKWVITSAASLSFFAVQGTAASAASHKVSTGDTLWKLSQQEGVSVDELKQANNRTNDMIYVGEVLTIPEKETVHTVVQGETLFSISQTYNTSVDRLKDLNGLQSDLINVGQQLVVTGERASEAAPAPQPTDVGVAEAEKDLLARLVEAEAKGEPYQGKVAVATVVMNRVSSPEFPNSITEVINQPLANGGYEFSPVGNGTINQPASDESRRAVEEALANPDHQNPALFFYNPQIATNSWLETKQVTAVIGNHVFAK